MTSAPDTEEPLPARLPSLTSGRVILFVIVFLTHAVGAAQFFRDARVTRLATVLPDAIATLSLFFVLSGFVLTWQRPWQMPFSLFARKRILKIFPSHVVIWAVTLVLVSVITPLALIAPTPAGPAVANLFLVQGWIPDPQYVFSVYGINWSVSADVVCYLALPLMIRPILRIPKEQLWLWLAGLMVVIVAIPGVIGTTVGGEPWGVWAPLSWAQVYLVYLCPLTKLPEFLLGVILARMVQTGVWRTVRVRWCLLLIVLVGASLEVLPVIYRSSGVMAVAVCFLVPILAMRDMAGRSRWLATRPMIVLGDATYAAYLVQFPVLGVAKTLIGPTRTFGVAAGAAIVLGLLAVNVLIGLTLYRVVEQPVLRRFSVSSRAALAEGNRRRTSSAQAADGRTGHEEAPVPASGSSYGPTRTFPVPATGTGATSGLRSEEA